MEYFIYCRDKPGTEELREQFGEAHWSFMDQYAGAMIARGPTLTADRTKATGSMHIVELPDAGAARAFAFSEPYYRAGVFGEVLLRRWRNSLGRTMWDFRGDPATNRRYLVIGHGRPGVGSTCDALVERQRRHLNEDAHREHFIVRGPLLSDDGRDWVGSAMLVEFPDRAAVETMLARAPFVEAGLYTNVEVLDWQFGGRPSSTESPR